MKFISFLGANVVCLSTFVVAQSAPVVNLGYAQYRGIENATIAGVITYFGLRYAAPPTGELRGREPVPIEYGNNYDASISSMPPRKAQSVFKTRHTGTSRET